jgi:periplasmic copper chaperone A
MKRLSFVLAALSLSTAAFAGAADNIVIHEPYVRLAPPNAQATGAFMVIRNAGEKDVKLLKAENPASKVTELHTHLNDKGVMRMRQVQSIDVPAKGEAVLQPGGLHVMLIDMKAPLKEGDVVPMTLTFDDGSSKKVDIKVQKMVPAGMQMRHGQH